MEVRPEPSIKQDWLMGAGGFATLHLLRCRKGCSSTHSRLHSSTPRTCSSRLRTSLPSARCADTGGTTLAATHGRRTGIAPQVPEPQRRSDGPSLVVGAPPSAELGAPPSAELGAPPSSAAWPAPLAPAQ
eukprot:scaffold20659_cov64-Phaeocystis_antarctica.AAC.3